MEHKSPSPKKEPEGLRTEIFVYGFDPSTTIEEIKSLFSSHNINIESIKFENSDKKVKNRGFAFFSVESNSIAERIIGRSYYLKGRIIHCDYKFKDKEKQNASKRKRVFVGGLPRSANDNFLRKFFSQFGEIRAAYSIKDKNGRSKCFGYVDFKEEETARELVKMGRVFFKMGESDRGRYIQIKEYKKRGDDMRISNFDLKKFSGNNFNQMNYSSDFNPNFQDYLALIGNNNQTLNFGSPLTGYVGWDYMNMGDFGEQNNYNSFLFSDIFTPLSILNNRENLDLDSLSCARNVEIGDIDGEEGSTVKREN